jgi:excisionase family DNA binding protein
MNAPIHSHPLLQNRLAVSRAEVAELLGVSETLAYRLMRCGGLTTIPAGRRRLVPVKGLLEFLASGDALKPQAETLPIDPVRSGQTFGSG